MKYAVSLFGALLCLGAIPKGQSGITVTSDTKQYYIENNEENKAVWYTAFRRCFLKGMQLVTINSKEELTLLQNSIPNAIINNRFWTSGLNVQKTGVYWTGTKEVAKYLNWNEAGTEENELCISLDTGFYYSPHSCNEAEYYICDAPYVALPADTTGGISLSFENKRYFVQLDLSLRATWYGSFDICSARNMKPVSIQSEEERTFLNDKIVVGTTTKFWTSGLNAGNEAIYWAGAQKTADYMNWSEEKPTGDIEQCIAVDYLLKYTYSPCSFLARVICEAIIDSDVTTASSTTPTTDTTRSGNTTKSTGTDSKQPAGRK